MQDELAQVAKGWGCSATLLIHDNLPGQMDGVGALEGHHWSGNHSCLQSCIRLWLLNTALVRDEWERERSIKWE